MKDIQSGIRDLRTKNAGACSSVWLERTPDKREVDGSTPSRPTMQSGATRRVELDFLHCNMRLALAFLSGV